MILRRAEVARMGWSLPSLSSVVGTITNIATAPLRLEASIAGTALRTVGGVAGTALSVGGKLEQQVASNIHNVATTLKPSAPLPPAVSNLPIIVGAGALAVLLGVLLFGRKAQAPVAA